MPEYSLRKVVYDVRLRAFWDDPNQLISHLRFTDEVDAWSALRQLMDRGMDGAGWYVCVHETSDSHRSEGEAA